MKPEEAFVGLDLKSKDVPVFLNGVGGLGSPFWQPDFLSRFEDPPTESETTPTQKMQAVLESVLFLIQANLDELRAASGEPGEIVLTGGLPREPAFAQGLADLSGVEVAHPERAEATARGVAFLLSAELGRWPEERSRATPPRKNHQ